MDILGLAWHAKRCVLVAETAVVVVQKIGNWELERKTLDMTSVNVSRLL